MHGVLDVFINESVYMHKKKNVMADCYIGTQEEWTHWLMGLTATAPPPPHRGEEGVVNDGWMDGWMVMWLL